MIKALLYDEIVRLALKEDIGTGDITTASTISPHTRIEGEFIAKEAGVICGLFVAARVFELVDPTIVFLPAAGVSEGYAASAGEVIARVSGSARNILTAERTALNIVQHMCGVATMAARYKKMVEGYDVVIADTRKTMPGLRYPDKYAVLCGGGHNHRRNLAEMLMLKDNHIDAAGSMTKAVELLRGRYNPCPPIEVECRNHDEISEAVACRVDRIMLDNMTPDMLPEALEMIPSSIETEISGGVSLDTIRAYATVSTVRKPDFISVGRITHSAVTADLSMRIAKESL